MLRVGRMECAAFLTLATANNLHSIMYQVKYNSGIVITDTPHLRCQGRSHSNKEVTMSARLLLIFIFVVSKQFTTS
ncbi:hypothetical protein HanRHA438_Chr00c30g0854991 [Helianthus annuus]|nr:hypothetical protein HanIR_Chr03g0127431 [Helianthus annuus]KAJ0954060.1 hypothetical protein HanRHA438_Chr00c30g0854991 [Helianthus annuus]